MDPRKQRERQLRPFEGNPKMKILLQRIVERQRLFFNKNDLSDISVRQSQLDIFFDMVGRKKRDLANALYNDIGRCPDETIRLEIAPVMHGILECKKEGVLKRWGSQEVKKEKVLINCPKGVVLIIGCASIPILSVLKPTMEAIAAGNTVVIKPSEKMQSTSSKIFEIFKEFFLENLIVVVEGGAAETQALLEEEFDHIHFTGSRNTLKFVLESASKFRTPVTSELERLSVVFVGADTDIQNAAHIIAERKWLNAGQTCLAPDYVVTTACKKNKLITALKDEFLSIYGQNPRNSKFFSEIISKEQWNDAKKMTETWTEIIKIGDFDRKSNFIPPMILEAVITIDSEAYCPVLLLIEVKDLVELKTVVEKAGKMIRLHLFTKDKKIIEEFASTSCGMVEGLTINNIPAHLLPSELKNGQMLDPGHIELSVKKFFNEKIIQHE